MAHTVRQMILNALLEQGPLSAKEISGLIRISEKEVYAHLLHIRKSLQHGPRRLMVAAPRCKDCGFRFAKRERLFKPGHCPKCKGTYIEEPIFAVT